MSDVQFTGTQRPITPLQLRALCAKSNAPALLRITVQYATILGTGWLIHLAAAREAWWWLVPLVIAQAYFIGFQFMAVHETAHKTAFRTRWINAVVGQTSGALIMLPYEYYTLFHWDHHRYTQDEARDPELLFKTVPRNWLALAFTFTGITQVLKRFLLMARHAITGRVTAPWIPEARRGLIVLEARLYLLVYATLLASSLALQTAALLWAWLLPLFIGQLMLRPYLLSEHTGCATTPSAFENTRTTYTNAAMHWFAWNMPYHAEHHAYPSVPFHALPKLNALIDSHILHKGQGYLNVYREVWGHLRSRAGQSGSSTESTSARA
ncbi:MAG: fatty acid desaturase [Ferrovibrio sp.]|uniref:fatty acid desaturase n=1 Tax=Ferrovibrio sp. TaxID=1917215 RepID=UPI00260C3481|nr:fatty acid desaturase [Ferrovibrio sp.]MCW0233001.1 fatty acid desaturase [Ferrovibrio sp.]